MHGRARRDGGVNVLDVVLNEDLWFPPAAGIALLASGQGTINVPSWSPDSRLVAFVAFGKY